MALLATFAVSSTAQAQQPTVTYISHADSAENVPISPTIRIRTNFLIDSTRLYFRPDSSTAPEASVFIVPTIHVDSLADSLIGGGLPMEVQYTVEDDTTLAVSINGLDYNEMYQVRIPNLWVIDGSGDTVQAPDERLVFTTALPPHRLVYSSAILPAMNCSDTLWFIFNRPLDSASASTVVKVVSIDEMDSNSTETSVSSMSWYNTDKTAIFTTISGLTPGDGIRLKVELHPITGDSADNRSYYLYVSDEYQLTVTANSLDTTIPMTEIPDYFPGTGVYSVGDSVTFYTPGRVGNHEFSYWSVPGKPEIDSATTRNLTVSQSCSELESLELVAMYSPIRFDTIELSVGTNATLAVYQNGTYIGGEGDYIVYEGEDIVAYLLPDSGYYFGSWFVSDTADAWSIIATNGVDTMDTRFIVTFDPGPTSIYAPDVMSPSMFGTVITTPASDFGTTATVRVSEAYGEVIDQIVSIAPTTTNCTFPGWGCTTCDDGTWTSTCLETSKGVTKSYSVTVQNPCFEIYRVTTVKDDGTGKMVVNEQEITAPTGSHTEVIATNQPYEEVHFFVRRKRLQVLVEERTTSGNESRLNDRNWADIQKPVPVGNATGANSPDLPSSSNQQGGVLYNGNPDFLNLAGPTASTDTREYYLLCGSDVTFEAEAGESGVTFDNWHDGVGYVTNTNQTFSHLVIAPTKVQAQFGEEFRIDRIGLYVGTDQTPTYYAPDEWISPDDVFILPTGATKVVIEFTSSVNKSTAREGIWANDRSERIDGNSRQRYNINGVNDSWAPYNGNNDAQLTFTLDDNLPVPKMMDVALTINDKLKSATDQALQTIGTFRFTTEMPRIKVTFNEIEIGTDGDGDKWPKGAGEIYTHWNCVYADSRGVEEETTGNSPPSTGGDDPGGDPGVWSMDEEDKKTINNDLILTGKVQRDGVLRLEVHSRERDNGDFYSRLDDFFSAVDQIVGQVDNDIVTGTTASTVLQATQIGVRAVQAVYRLIGGNSNDASSDAPMGRLLLLYSMTDWWGAHPSVSSQITRTQRDKVYYTLDILLD